MWFGPVPQGSLKWVNKPVIKKKSEETTTGGLQAEMVTTHCILECDTCVVRN
jgi:hypothetical protein